MKGFGLTPGRKFASTRRTGKNDYFIDAEGEMNPLTLDEPPEDEDYFDT